MGGPLSAYWCSGSNSSLLEQLLLESDEVTVGGDNKVKTHSVLSYCIYWNVLNSVCCCCWKIDSRNSSFTLKMQSETAVQLPVIESSTQRGLKGPNHITYFCHNDVWLGSNIWHFSEEWKRAPKLSLLWPLTVHWTAAPRQTGKIMAKLTKIKPCLKNTLWHILWQNDMMVNIHLVKWFNLVPMNNSCTWKSMWPSPDVSDKTRVAVIYVFCSVGLSAR